MPVVPMTADLKIRLREAMAEEPLLVDSRAGYDTFRRGDMTFAVPIVPPGANPYAATAIAAARSAYLDSGCRICAARLHVRARDGAVTVTHRSTCPGRRVACYVAPNATTPAGSCRPDHPKET